MDKCGDVAVKTSSNSTLRDVTEMSDHVHGDVIALSDHVGLTEQQDQAGDIDDLDDAPATPVATLDSRQD